jgi:hypothetical protein
MKKRLHNKKAGIAILLALIAISVVEIISRVLILKESMINTATTGEPLLVIIFAAIILIMNAKGKDRTCYICYGAWLAYFVLNQVFELPGLISTLFSIIDSNNWVFTIGNLAFLCRILSMLAIIAIGVLVVEYMTDGTICNRAFNALCIATVVLIMTNIVISICVGIAGLYPMDILIQAINNVSRLAMVFMFTFFAYDSAKHQLKKANLTK